MFDLQLQILVPVLGGAVAIATIGLAQRWGLKGRESPMRFLALGFSLIVAMLAGIYVVRWGLTFPAQLLPGFWTAVFVGSAANYGIAYFHAKASTYKQGEASFVAPLAAMTPGLIVLLAVTLGEIPGPAGLIGVILMALGSWILLYPHRPNHWWEYLSPLYRLSLVLRFRSLGAEERERAKVVWLAFGAACLATVGLLCDGLYTRRGVDMQGMWLAITVLLSILAVGYVAQYLLQPREIRLKSGSFAEHRFPLALIIFSVAWVAALWLTTPLYFETYVAYVGSLKRLHVIFAIILGAVLLGEKDLKRRLAVGLLVVLGALLIASEDLPEKLATQVELFGL